MLTLLNVTVFPYCSKDCSLIHPRHLSLRDTGYTVLLWNYFYGTYLYKLKKPKLLTGLTCVLEENYKFTQKQNLEVKQLFV